MNKEVNHLLNCGRVKLHVNNKGQKVTSFDAFVCALTPLFLLYLKEWMITADDNEMASNASFDNIIAFSVKSTCASTRSLVESCQTLI